MMAVIVYSGSARKHSRSKKSMGFVRILWGVAACLIIVSGVRTQDAPPTCGSVRSYFESRGMLNSVDIQESPNSDGGGLCSTRGCCGTGARARLTSSAKHQLEAALRTALNKLASLLAERAIRFDSFFKELLQQSKLEFHEMFKRTYGMIYERHSYVFTELFGELERYYTNGDVDLARLMDKFFVVLYQKMFTVLNSQYSFDDKYLQCVSEHMRDTQPFDDVPHKLSIQLRRAFVATRTFQKALNAGAEVAKNMNEVGVTAECAAAWARMRWCGGCSGAGVPACSRFCINVARGCLPLQADLAQHWDAYVEAVDKVADRLLGPFNIAMVVEPIDIKISEAIMNFQEHAQDISQKIFTSCGKPVLGGVPASAATGPFFGPAKRERRSLPGPSLEIYEDSNSDMDDFEIEESYESLLSRHPSLRRIHSSDEYDLNSLRELAEKADQRRRFLEYMRGEIGSEELEYHRDRRDAHPELEYRRERRDANPEPAKGSKEIEFEAYNFDGRAKKKAKKPTSVAKASSKESGASVDGGIGGRGGEVLERLVREARGRVRNTRKYWSHLPYVLCNEDEVAAQPSPDLKCHNGTARAPYLPGLAGEGMTALATNPEVRGPPPTKSQTLEAAQESLRDITSKLKNAYNGLDVDWKDYVEDTSASLLYGSGSGDGEGSGDDDIPDDDEDHRRRIYDDDTEASGHGPITEPEAPRPEPPRPESPRPDEPYVPSVVGAPPSHNIDLKDASHTDYDGGDVLVRKVEYDKTAEKPYREHEGAPAAGSAARQEMSLHRALATYLFPIVCAWLGGIVTEFA